MDSIQTPLASSSLTNHPYKVAEIFKNKSLGGNNNNTHQINNFTSNESKKFTKAVNEFHQRKNNNMLQHNSSKALPESK